MKVFVTVGNTQYNQLIKAVDEHISAESFDVTIQLADGHTVPKNHKHLRFTDNINQYFDEADVVISHAGAGSVFRLLELNKKLIVVPNFERVDDHQLDLANFIHENNYANVCFQLDELFHNLQDALKQTYNPYKHTPFAGYELISELLLSNRVHEDNNLVGGIKVDLYKNIDELVEHIVESENVISGSAIAINPEKIIRSMQKSDVKDVLNSATIRYPDGIGVVKTLSRKTGLNISRIPGCELWEALMSKAGESNIPVYLVGSSEEVISTTKSKLEQQYVTNVCGYQNGYFKEENIDDVIASIAVHQPKIVAVALGSPKQELFISRCQKVLPNAFYMGVGGSFDVYTDKVRRAPLIYRKLNLEWFYRVLNEPHRIFRQGNLLKYLYLELTRRL